MLSRPPGLLAKFILPPCGMRRGTIAAVHGPAYDQTAFSLFSTEWSRPAVMAAVDGADALLKALQAHRRQQRGSADGWNDPEAWDEMRRLLDAQLDRAR